MFDYSNPRLWAPTKTNTPPLARPLPRASPPWEKPFGSHFETNVLHAKLTALGFREVEDLNPALIRERYFTNRGGSSPDRGGHIVRAATV